MDMLNEIKDLMCRIDKGYSDYVMLTEGLSDKLYHFTSIGNAFEICKNDVLYLQSAYAKDADNYDGKRKFYLSCTRMPNIRHGYSRKFMHGGVRIVLDGRRLSNDFKGKPINYWKGLGDKYSFYEHLPMSYEQTKLNNDYNIRKFKEQNPGATDDDVAKYLQKNFSDSNQYHIGNESEDRIFSYKSTIENAHDYIVSVDVLLPNLYESKDELNVAYGFLNTVYNRRVHIYGDIKEFNSIKGKDANQWVYDNYDYNGIAYNGSKQVNGRYKTVLMDLIKFISFGNPEFDGDRFGGAVANLLKRYGLSKYTNLIGQIQKDMRYSSLRDVVSSLEGKRREISDSPNADTAKIAQMMTDYFRELGADTFSQAYKIKEDMLNGDKDLDWNEIDGNITRPLLVFFGSVLVPHPEREKFNNLLSISSYYDAQSLADSLANEVMDYRGYSDEVTYNTTSKNVNSLYQYLYKLFRTGTVQQVLDVFNKIGITNDLLENYRLEYEIQNLNFYDAVMKNTVTSKLQSRVSDDYRAINRAKDWELAPLFKKQK